MNEQDRNDVLMVVEAVLDNYFTETLTARICEEIDQSLRDNWHILKLIRARKGGKEDALDKKE